MFMWSNLAILLYKTILLKIFWLLWLDRISSFSNVRYLLKWLQQVWLYMGCVFIATYVIRIGRCIWLYLSVPTIKVTAHYNTHEDDFLICKHIPPVRWTKCRPSHKKLAWNQVLCKLVLWEILILILLIKLYNKENPHNMTAIWFSNNNSTTGNDLLTS